MSRGRYSLKVSAYVALAIGVADSLTCGFPGCGRRFRNAGTKLRAGGKHYCSTTCANNDLRTKKP